VLDYESTSHLPVGLATNGKMSPLFDSRVLPKINLCITDDSNQNLSPAQKLLMMWHYRFGHKNFAHVQSILRLPVFQGEKYKAFFLLELIPQSVLPACTQRLT
jgi:hypothetical protein